MRAEPRLSLCLRAGRAPAGHPARPHSRRWRGAPVAGALAGLIALGFAGVGCDAFRREEPQPTEPRVPPEPEVPAYVEDTVGERARFVGRDEVPVQGFGFVTGLDSTGSTILTPGVRRDILFLMRRNDVENPEALLASRDTAAVVVGGWLPPGAVRGEVFDLEVRAVPGSDATSLEGGFLLECDLKRVASGRSDEAGVEAAALGRGDIFVSLRQPGATGPEGDPRVGRILAGGRSLINRQFRLVLLEPSARTADQVVRLINARFPGAAEGRPDASIDLTVPRRFRDDKPYFLDLVGALYMRELPSARDDRIRLLIEYLEQGRDVERVALYLEAFGSAVVPHLKPLVRNVNETVRFYAGRTLARLDNGLAVSALEGIVLNDNSPYQEEAVKALGYMQRGLGLGLLGRALNAEDARVRIAAWRSILKVSPGRGVRRVFPDKFFLSDVPTEASPFVYVSRTRERHLAVFGDVRIRPPALAETSRVTLSAPAGADRVRVVTQHAGRSVRLDVPLELVEAVEAMAAPFVEEGADEVTGLDLSYSEIVSLVHQLDRGKALTGPVVLQPLEYRMPRPRPIGEMDEADEEAEASTEMPPVPGAGAPPAP